MKNLIPKFLIYFIKRSRFAPPCEGEFKKTAEFGGKYVYQGRLLTREEFNALDGNLYEKDRYTETVRAECVMVEDESVQSDDTPPVTESAPATLPPVIDPDAVVTDSTPPVTDDGFNELRDGLSAMQNKQLIVEFAESKGIVVSEADFTRDALEAEVVRIVIEMSATAA